MKYRRIVETGMVLVILFVVPQLHATGHSAAESIADDLHSQTTTSGSGSGSLGEGGVASGVGTGGGIGTTLTGTSGSGNFSPDGSGPTNSGVWYNAGPDSSYFCGTNGRVQDNPTGPDGPGDTFPTKLNLINQSGQIVLTTYVCPTVGSPSAPLGLPPLPPSPAEAIAATPFPRPSFGLNPSQLGLTGLDSWFWDADVSSAVSSTSTVRGYTVVTTARPVKFYWWFGDSTSASSSSAGTKATPSVVHVYQTKGVYAVTLTIAWQGQYTFTGNGTDGQTVSLGTVDEAPVTMTYRVQEVRSVLLTPTS